ncbi:helix-turn-helix domain-containing protein [Vreelandella sulfidaeris]
MTITGKDRYEAVKAVDRQIKYQGKWRKKGNRITQVQACKKVDISTHQYRKWKAIISKNVSKPLDEIYSLLEDKRYAPNKLTAQQEEIVIKYAEEFPDKSYREIAKNIEEEVGRKLHHGTVSSILKK